MKILILLNMSFLSALFGCGGKKTPATALQFPRFPASDNPAARIEPVSTDSSFYIKSFFITQDKNNVYAFGYRPSDPVTVKGEPVGGMPPNDYRIFCLDAHGQILHHIDVLRAEWCQGASFGMLDKQPAVLLNDHFLILDPEKWTVKGKIPTYYEKFFPSKQKVELMTPDEQRDAYAQCFDAMLEKCSNCRWLDWTPGGAYFVLTADAAWSPLNYEEDYLRGLKARMPETIVPLNPDAGTAGGQFRISDTGTTIRDAGKIDAGTQLDYPNYKRRTVINYEMNVGNKTVRFSTTDKSRHDLHLAFSDNLLLTTSDGAAWVKYEGVLYRIKI